MMVNKTNTTFDIGILSRVKTKINKESDQKRKLQFWTIIYHASPKQNIGLSLGPYPHFFPQDEDPSLD